jgi:rhamnosyl/mannosyltransferase
MKILQINKLYYPAIGGVESVVQNIAERLNGQDDFIVDVLACQNKGGRQTENINGIKIYRAASFGKILGMPISLDFFRLSFKLFRQYDKIIIHYPFPLASFICPFIPKRKLIICYHSDIIRQKISRIILSPLIKISLKRASLILAGGNNIIKYSSWLYPLAKKCRVLPYGTQANFQTADEEKSLILKKKYSNGKILLLAVGRLVYYKGFTYAIKAMGDIDAKLLIIGTGPEEKKLRQIIKDKKLENKIEIIGTQERLAPFFLAADIFLFPSIARSEAFGLVQLEAMAAGKAIINTYLHTAVEEVSQNNISGVTIKPKDSQALATAINTLIANPELRNKLGAQGQERYQKHYRLEIFTQNLKNILKSS